MTALYNGSAPGIDLGLPSIGGLHGVPTTSRSTMMPSASATRLPMARAMSAAFSGSPRTWL